MNPPRETSRRNLIGRMIFALQAVLIGCAIAMGIMTRMSWLALVGFGLVGGSVLALEVTTARQGEQVWRWGQFAGWMGTLLVPSSLMFAGRQAMVLDGYYSALAWLLAAAIGLASHRVTVGSLKRRWQALAMAWALGGGCVWLAAAYAANVPGAFYAGLLLNLALLITCKHRWQMPALGILTTNTLILAIVFVPIVDFITRPPGRPEANEDVAGTGYSYGAARIDSHAFARWWRRYKVQLERSGKALYVGDPAHQLPLRLRPNSQASFFQSRIRINSRGFRGEEIAVEKGNAYRIVALGESTTFGLTLTQEHRPWPELLEQMIRERLKPNRPVEVINAGVPTYSLVNNLCRMSADILPLKPDLIISYHGWNGFPMLNEALPPIIEKRPPVYKPRPLPLLAECEYRLKRLYFKRCQATKLIQSPHAAPEPMETEYAEAYQQLTQITKTNRIRLVLANYSMAVNSDSDKHVIEFYRQVFPEVYWYIKANLVHSDIVQGIAQQHAEVCMVDTHPQLDGAHEKFTDLMHFAPEGDQQLAETFFAGIRRILDEELSGAPH